MNAHCINVVGAPGFTCECNEGYQGDGIKCEGLFSLLYLLLYITSIYFMYLVLRETRVCLSKIDVILSNIRQNVIQVCLCQTLST